MSHEQEATDKVHDWMKQLDDEGKRRFALNWRIPHSLFNVASKFYPGDEDDLQKANWFAIYKSCDIGNWSHGGRVALHANTFSG